MQNLYTRTITGIVFVALTIGSLLLHPLAFMAIIYVYMIAGLLEFFRLPGNLNIYPQRALGFVIGSVFYLVLSLSALGIIPPRTLAVLPPLFLVFFIAEFFRDKQKSIQNIAFGIFAIAYISIPLSTLIFLLGTMLLEGQPHWLFAFSFIMILWCYDTFAYLTGMLFGKHKLYEEISPKKTWEGAFGGTVFALAAAFVLSLFFKEINVYQWLTAALIIVISGTLGDLSESLLKRKFNVKDTGNFFPGHGGMLDRFDAVLFAAPALFCYLTLLNL